MAEQFFNEQAEQSQVKTAIVTKYFTAWARVIGGHLKNKADKRIAYLDLFAGPGRYKDGAKSTPILILETAIADDYLRENLVTIFNDKEAENASSLVLAINELLGIGTLHYQPQVYTEEVGQKVVRLRMDGVPTLFFIDPWGYKGLSLRLINSVLKDWACECIFFFNYGRINAGLSNHVVQDHMAALFGEDRCISLRSRLDPMSSEERELTIVEEICAALNELGGKYTLPFRFKSASGARTKHHLIFVSKHSLGYKIMKEVMARESSTTEQGVPTFEYSPASKRQPLLFELARPLDDLADMLLESYAGRTMTMGQIYEDHNYGRRYIERNYKDILNELERSGRILGNPPHSKRRKVRGETTCGNDVRFTFPGREKL